MFAPGLMTGNLALLTIVVVALVGGIIGVLRGHNVALAMIVSVVLGWLIFPIVGWILLLVIPGKKRCPKCRERIQNKATQCRFCGYSYAQVPTTI